MSTPAMTDDDTAALLRDLAERAAPSTTCPPDLAGRVLALRRRKTVRRRQLVVVGAAALVAGAVAASAWVGHSRFVDYLQPSAAMSPTIRLDETAVLDRSLTAQRGDVVLVSVTDRGYSFDTLSRVIGLPGDTVSCPATARGTCAGVEVDGVRLTDPYLAGLTTAPFPAATVPADRLFLIGDNRVDAADTRVWSPTTLQTVRGVVVEIRSPAGVPRAVPGAPVHQGPGDDLVDPGGPVPPAPVAPAGGP